MQAFEYIIELIKQKKVDEAIQTYRDTMNITYDEAKQAIDNLILSLQDVNKKEPKWTKPVSEEK
jgi:hypothetical protein